jgi:hypothetical protein
MYTNTATEHFIPNIFDVIDLEKIYIKGASHYIKHGDHHIHVISFFLFPIVKLNKEFGINNNCFYINNRGYFYSFLYNRCIADNLTEDCVWEQGCLMKQT